MSFDQRELRNALGQFATGVAIVTASVAGNRLGSTISSFNSVSLDPPLVLFSLIGKSLGFAQWKSAEAFGISILRESQRDLSNRFAKAGTEKWTGVTELYGKNGAPLLDGCVAHFECEPYAIHEGGDHEIFVCRVTDFQSTLGPAPLIFFAGKYRHLTSLDTDTSPPADNMWLHGW